jgi:MFS family permease
VPKGRLGTAYGLIQSMDSAGAIAGPLIAFVLLARYGMRTVFGAAAIPGALCVLVALFGIREKRRSQTASGAELQPAKASTVQLTSAMLNAAEPSGSAKFPTAFYVVVFAVTLFSLGNSSDMFLVMRAQSAGIPVAVTPLLGLVFNLTYTLGSWPAGWFSDRFSRYGSSRRGSSRQWIAAAGYLIFAGVYFVFGRAPSALAIWIAMAVYGFYYALTQPVLKALVVEAVGEKVRGRALGIYFFVTSVATLAASLITGELWKHYGPGVPFFFSAGMALVSAALLVMNRASD